MGMSTALMEKIRAKRKDIQAKTGKRDDVLRVPKGKHKFRILPCHPDSAELGEFWADFGQHFIKSDEKNEQGNFKVKSVYVCVDKTFGKPCPICEGIESLVPQATDDDAMNLLEESKCKRAEVLINVLHRTGDKPDTPQILQLTPTTFETILGLMEEYDDITDLNEGTDIIIERSGVGLNTKYTVMPAAKSQPVSEDVLTQMTDLKAYVLQEHDEGLKRALTALNATVGLLDAPMTAAKAISHKKVDDDMAGVMDGEFDEMEALDGLDDEMEVAAPKAKVKAKAAKPAAKKAPVVEETTDDDDDDMDALLADLEAM